MSVPQRRDAPFDERQDMVDLAIDIGQTQARIRTIAEDVPGREVEIDGFAYGSDLLTVIVDIAQRSAEGLGLDHVGAIAVGSTGLYGHVSDVHDVLRRLHETLGTTRVVVADDAVTAFLGARGDHDGVVVAAGTGIVGLGRGPAGAARVDGVGGMIGDEGSGWWIGRRGLIAAISSADGRRGASAPLLDRLVARFGPVADFPALLAGATSPVAVVASFAKDVADVAREGDAVAAGIWREAGEHLGTVIAAAASRAGLGDAAEWTLIGRLSLAVDLLEPGLGAGLDALLPNGKRVPSVGEPLDGVARLLTVDAEDYGPMIGEAIGH
ncbi:ATPase [Labedella phragmitis]|uniref:ATPase n=1 Tax=Labedella phragmitis TaxID=2498849 RepID=A0A444PY73_9MICO|nr:BadF/BadG/BcrA/BcrD ATPase family protein [Labedella phragmitis]RWZ52825.1 ATPase [Labedella phragmitis]